MSSSQRPERVVHQDYIVRIRYSNQLPPPPNTPKLLGIPGTGLAGGQYTSAAYASRLAREQPLNIEADAELGMPIDLIGMPGVFDGDERAIMARPAPHAIHPADKALLKPLSAMGKSATAQGGVSFLRRTEYISSQGPQFISSSTSKDLLRLKKDKKRPLPSVKKDDPINIIRNINKGFDVGYPSDAYTGDDTATNIKSAPITDADTRAWLEPKHPSKPELELLDSYPVLPDLDALPDAGYYVVQKFVTNPVGESDFYDERLNAAVLRPIESDDMRARYEQKLAEWDPSGSKSKPLMEYDYEYYLPEEGTGIRGIKRKFNPSDPENDDPELYSHELDDGRRAFKYPRVRTYETYNQTAGEDAYNDSLALALHDPETDVGEVPGAKKRLAKAAYFYPIVQRTALRPKRKVGPIGYSQQSDGQVIDLLQVEVTDPSEEFINRLKDLQAGLENVEPSTTEASTQ
ncbi:Paf1 complex protein [Polychaeton citri CBS 116435]|uniref:Paf1 complex protein n=1 Tax=Polychaeton citri CBS 116435 TaxID=1314669 RepID=A0A9P4UTV8_9PEZI|nr:Paf1 complex protein [Polychaeton citri CBS 116435]